MTVPIQIVCLMGPTASGKTDLAIQLTQSLPFEIISVDSAMVYRGLDIGTAKPSVVELAQTPHHLIDIRDPSESYSAADFCRDASNKIADIHARGRIPLLVGGTMLYFRALQQGLSPLPIADQGVREQILARAEQNGWQALHQELAAIDPAAANRIHPNDPQRLQRALEVFYLTGKSLSDHFKIADEISSNYEFCNLALLPESRIELHHKIARRFHQMLAQGLVVEVEALYRRGDLNSSLPAMRAVGYRQVWQYLAGELTYEAMVEKAITATRQLAKRQMTWLRSWPDLHAFRSEDLDGDAILAKCRDLFVASRLF